METKFGAILCEPAAYLGVLGGALFFGHLLPGLLLLAVRRQDHRIRPETVVAALLMACRAQGEILALPQHGWLGKLMALMMGPRVTANLLLRMERDMLPLDSQAFNRFHHGGKVRAQDVEALRDCLAEGQRHGQPMVALQALLATSLCLTTPPIRPRQAVKRKRRCCFYQMKKDAARFLRVSKVHCFQQSSPRSG